MASWDLSEIGPGQVIKSDHMKQAMNDAQGDIDLNGNALTDVGEITFTDPAATRDNLGLGDSATKDVGTGSGNVAAGNDSRFVTNGNSHDHSGGDGGTIAYSSLSGTPTLGDAAALDVGTGAGTVAAGDDLRFVTNGNSHDHSGGDGAQINHTTLSNIGTNTHAQIDTHIASTSNPHSVTKSQVGLGNVDNYATSSQADAEAGIATNMFMTPLRTAQAIAALGAGGATDIDDLGDVTITTPSDGDVLTYDSGSWINSPATGGGASDIVDLGDVNIGSPSDGEVLTYDSGSSKWINAAPPSGSLPTQTGHDGAMLYTDGTDAAWVDGINFDGTNLVTSVPAYYLRESADATGFTFSFKKRGQTGDATGAVKNGSTLGYLSFSGWDGSAYPSLPSGFIACNAAEDFSSGHQAAQLDFGTFSTSGFFPQIRMSLLESGRILMSATDDSTNKLQVGGGTRISANSTALTAGPTGTMLHIANANSTATRLTLDSFGEATAITGRRANGTASSKSAVSADDLLLGVTGFGYGTTGYSSSARAIVQLNASESWSDTAQGSYIRFYTTAATTTTTAEKMRLSDAGNLLIGTTSILQTTSGRTYLGVRGASAAGAIELSATQADADASIHGAISTSDTNTTATDKRLGAIVFQTDGSTANNRGGRITFYTKADNASGLNSSMYLTQGGRLLVGTSTDDGSNKVQVNGTVKATTLIGAFDAETSGSTLTMPFVLSFVAAKVQNGTASAAFSTPASGAPTPTAVVGSNTIYGTLSFSDSETEYVQDRISLPFDWTGNIDAQITWRSSATSGNVVWQIATAGVNDGSTGDPSFNTANTVTDATKGTTLQFNTCTISSLTTTGLAAGGEFMFKILRDPSHASDTLGAAAELISVKFILRRAI